MPCFKLFLRDRPLEKIKTRSLALALTNVEVIMKYVHKEGTDLPNIHFLPQNFREVVGRCLKCHSPPINKPQYFPS